MATIDNLFPGNINAGTTISKVRKTWSPTTDPEKALRNIVKEAYTEKTEEDGALFRTAVCLYPIETRPSRRFINCPIKPAKVVIR